MRTITLGEYYVWYCEWCDSRNLTPWLKATDGKACCGGCQKEFPVSGSRHGEAGRGAQQRQAYL